MSRVAQRDPLSDPKRAIRRIYAYAAYRLGPGPDAEDVTSETIERALRYRASYDSERGEPIPWLIGIARACTDDALRRRRATGELGDVPGAEHEADVVERLTIAGAIGRLDARDRDLIALRYGADLKTHQIADVLDMTVNAVDVAIHRSRARLRDELQRAGVAESSRSRSRVQRPVLRYRKSCTETDAIPPQSAISAIAGTRDPSLELWWSSRGQPHATRKRGGA